jgi:hypothetical protein
VPTSTTWSWVLTNMGGLFIIGFMPNAAWGIGWALLLVLFDRNLGRKPRLSLRDRLHDHLKLTKSKIASQVYGGLPSCK